MRRDTRGQGQAPVRKSRTEAMDGSFAFRRSRTITGSAAASVRAAGEGRGQLQSSRLHEHSLRGHRRKLLAYLSLSLLLCGLLWYVVASYVGGGTLQTATTSTQPLKTQLDTSRYQTLVNAYFSQHPFERFVFSLNEGVFSQFIASHAPEVLSAQLEKGTGFGAGALTLTLREPVVAWTIKNQQYFVDAEGVAYTVNYFNTPTVVVTDKSGISAEAGVVASAKQLRFIGRVITLVNTSGISPVEQVELPANSTREVDLRLKDHTYTIKAHVDRDPAGQAADIINAVKYVDARDINPQYLDVRVSSKAFYRDAR